MNNDMNDLRSKNWLDAAEERDRRDVERRQAAKSLALAFWLVAATILGLAVATALFR